MKHRKARFKEKSFMGTVCRRRAVLFTLIFFQFACTPKESLESESWCDQELRPFFSKLTEVDDGSDWFRSYIVGEGVIAIAEPYNFQEIISYLIIGKDKALLFDTGMGMDSISNAVKKLTDLPVIVMNSHNHYDHIGSNHEFESVFSIGADYGIERAKNGLPSEAMKHEVAENAFCAERLPGFDKSNYQSKPYKISEVIKDGHIFDLGDRKIQVINTPGHMPDAVVLLDESYGYLWTGDMFYLGPIWLFDPQTNLSDYEESIEFYSSIEPKLMKVFPAHNIPIADPIRLNELKDAFQYVVHGNHEAQDVKNYVDESQGSVRFDFEHFSFMIRKPILDEFRKTMKK